ncbi:hypothetical protein ACFX2C_046821 [Malus domestica]
MVILKRQKIIFGLTTEKGLNPGVVEYNAMIKGFCKFGMMMDALSCFEKMQKVHHHPGEFAYSTIIDGCVKQHNLDATLSFFELIVKQGCKPNVVTKTSLIYGFCHKGDSCGDEGNRAKAASFFELMLKNKCIPNDVTFHYLVNGFTNNEPGAIPKEVNESQQNEKSICLGVFRRMISDGWFQKAAVYNSIIICLCHHGMGKTAIQLCEKKIQGMEELSIIPFNLKHQEFHTAVKLSRTIDDYLHQGSASEATLILQSLVNDPKSQDQEVDLKDKKIEENHHLCFSLQGGESVKEAVTLVKFFMSFM